MKLLPSLFTIGNLVCGVVSIINTYHGDYWRGAILIIFAHVLDIIDGRIARVTKTVSEFGVEFDSLADFVSFGIASGFLVYCMFLDKIGNAGVMLFALYVIATALRLARFNVTYKDKNYFLGLPAPASGGFLAILAMGYQVYLGEKTVKTISIIDKNFAFFYSIVPLIVFILSLLMVSRIRYISFKFFSFKPVSLRFLLIYIAIGMLIWLYPQNTIFLLYLSYILYGIAGIFFRIVKRSKI
ncbi:MAG: CDP-alcohol phosphatidyltransferase family protein [bacterium]|nr:CDP-alcohol phosphatidyltransferase family protein [bacterium]